MPWTKPGHLESLSRADATEAEAGADRGGRIRTKGLSLPKRVRYQAAPRPVASESRCADAERVRVGASAALERSQDAQRSPER